MAETSIEWTGTRDPAGVWRPGYSFNPWVGCTKVSPACDHCYAEGWAKRSGQPHLWAGERRRTTNANWRQPVKWNAAAEAAGVRAKVFCASLADVFDNQVPEQWRADLWSIIAVTPWLDWLLLTKRPQNIRKMLPEGWADGWPNVWLGTTVENQAEAERRIPHLAAVPATVRFLSCEPLLEPLNLRGLMRGNGIELDAMTGYHSCALPMNNLGEAQSVLAKLPILPVPTGTVTWVICGGESGGGARIMSPDWARSLRDQCDAVGTAFFMKQMTRKTAIPADLMVRQFPDGA